MSAPKHYTKHGVLLAVETGSYGSGTPTPAASTDGFHVHEAPDPIAEYQDAGELSGRVSEAYAVPGRVNASGLALSANLVHRWYGKGSAYSASTVSSAHIPLRLLGMSATLDATPGAEKYTYAVISDNFVSGVAELYAAKEKHALKGVYAESLEIAAVGPVVPTWTFGIKGIGSLPVDAAAPGITYSNKQNGPKATGIVFTLTSGVAFAGTIPEHTLRFARALDALTKQTGTADEHGGFQPGIPRITLDCVIRATTLQTSAPYLTTSLVSPYHLFDRAQNFAVQLNVGSVQFNRYKIAGNAVLTAPPTRRKVGEAMEWQCSLEFVPTTDTGLNFTIVTD